MPMHLARLPWCPISGWGDVFASGLVSRICIYSPVNTSQCHPWHMWPPRLQPISAYNMLLIWDQSIEAIVDTWWFKQPSRPFASDRVYYQKPRVWDLTTTASQRVENALANARLGNRHTVMQMFWRSNFEILERMQDLRSLGCMSNNCDASGLITWYTCSGNPSLSAKQQHHYHSFSHTMSSSPGLFRFIFNLGQALYWMMMLWKLQAHQPLSIMLLFLLRGCAFVSQC
jgi:hypothetical protein